MCTLQHLLRVIPVIGILTDRKAFKPIPNPGEVETVFDAPLEMFIKVSILSISKDFIVTVSLTILINEIFGSG